MPESLTYVPPPTIELFMQSDKRVRIVRGPVGSGKSSGMVMEILQRAMAQAPDPHDKIRRSRWAIVRNTLPQIKTTCVKTINELIRPIVEWRSDNTGWIRFNDVEAELLLMPLDTPENVQRLLSLDLTGAWMSELRELHARILMDVLSRCGRFPSMMHGGPTWYGVIGETNSFTEDSEWNKILEEKELEGKPLPKTWDYFVQPGARDANAENKANLAPGYYEDLIENNSPEWVEQYVDNIIAPSLAGEAVFRSSFKNSFHVAAEQLTPIPGQMLVLGMDFGRHPAAVFSQMDARGRLVILAEAIGDNMGVEQFCNSIVRPMLAAKDYQRLPVGVVGDPSGIARSQIGEESVFQALKRLGFSAQPAQTNDIDPRLRAVEKWFLQQRDGGPAILVSPNCTNLLKALRSKYRYARKKDGELHPVPEKTHPWSDIADALQYAVLGHSDRVLGRLVRTRGNPDRRPQIASGGWT